MIPHKITRPDFHVRTRTMYDLERTLVKFLSQVVEPYRFDNPTLNLSQATGPAHPIVRDPDSVPVSYDVTERAQTLALKVPPRVVCGCIPRSVTGDISLDRLANVPHVIVQAVSARAEKTETFATVRIFVCMYDENPDGGGYQDCLNMAEAIVIALTSFGQGAIDDAYPLVMPINWHLNENDTFPHYIAEINTQWELPSGRPMPDLSEGIVPGESISFDIKFATHPDYEPEKPRPYVPPVVPPEPTGPEITDSWPKENNSGNNYPLRGNTQRNYQTIKGNGKKLHMVEFVMNKVVSLSDPTESHLVGNLFAKLYASDGQLPIGAALETSAPVAVQSISELSLRVAFPFSDQTLLELDGDYAISLEKENADTQIWDSYWGFINNASDIGVPASGHYGVSGYKQYFTQDTAEASSWSMAPTQDMIFYLWTL